MKLLLIQLIMYDIELLVLITYAGADPGFQVRGAHLKNCAERREARNCWGISCEKSRFYAKKSDFFSNFRGRSPPPPGSAPGMAYQ
jgi:hypothetical protein